MKKIILGVVIVVMMAFGYQAWMHHVVRSELSLQNLDGLEAPLLKQTVSDSEFEIVSSIQGWNEISFQFPFAVEEIISKEEKGDTIKTIQYDFVDQSSFRIWDWEDNGLEVLFIMGNWIDFDVEAFDGEYEVLEFIFQQTPSDVPFWAGKDRLAEEYAVLMMKKMAMLSGGDEYIGDLQGLDILGFQYCTPDLCDTTRVQLFNKNSYLIFSFEKFTQKEIDYVLRSIEFS